MPQDVTALICELDGFYWSPRLPVIFQFFHRLHLTPELKDTAFLAVYIQDRLVMKLEPSKLLFHSIFNP